MVGFPSLALAVGMRPLCGHLLFHLFFIFLNFLFLLLGLNSPEKHCLRALNGG